MPPDLPGYYYDTSKNRYFKIQANHVAATGSKYSTQAVRAEKVITKTQQRDEWTRRAKTVETVTRSTLLQHPALCFDRRLGDLRKTARKTVAEYYAASLEGRDALTGLPLLADGKDIPRHPNIRPGSGSFAIDRGSGTLFGDFTALPSTEYNCHQRGTRMFALHRWDMNDDPFDTPYDDANPTSWRHTNKPDERSELYKLSHHETFGPVSQVERIASIGSGLVLWTEGRDHILQASRVNVGACDTGPFSAQHDMVFKAGFPARIQDVAVQPGSSSPMTSQPSYLVCFAMGDSLWLMDTSTSRCPMSEYPLNQTDGTSDIMTIHFKDHNVLMAGTRSGKMLLLDIREPPSSATSSGTKATRIQHSSAITHLRALPTSNRNTVLISGLAYDGTKTYDLRYTPSPCLKSHAPRANSYRLSPFLLTFAIPETRMQTQYGLGWAYDEELNLMVHASTDYVANHRVGIWDVTSGRMMRSKLAETVFEQPVGCADVVRVRDGAKSVVLGWGGERGRVVEFSCQAMGGWAGEGLGEMWKERWRYNRR